MTAAHCPTQRASNQGEWVFIPSNQSYTCRKNQCDPLYAVRSVLVVSLMQGNYMLTCCQWINFNPCDYYLIAVVPMQSSLLLDSLNYQYYSYVLIFWREDTDCRYQPQSTDETSSEGIIEIVNKRLDTGNCGVKPHIYECYNNYRISCRLNINKHSHCV